MKERKKDKLFDPCRVTASQARELLSLLRSRGVEVELTTLVKKALEEEK